MCEVYINILSYFQLSLSSCQKATDGCLIFNSSIHLWRTEWNEHKLWKHQSIRGLFERLCDEKWSISKDHCSVCSTHTQITYVLWNSYMCHIVSSFDQAFSLTLHCIEQWTQVDERIHIVYTTFLYRWKKMKIFLLFSWMVEWIIILS